MTLSARATALQGIGLAPRFVALQGFADVPVAVRTAIEPPSPGSASISLSEWLRRFGGPAAAPIGDAPIRRKKKRSKKDREEELLLLLQ